MSDFTNFREETYAHINKILKPRVYILAIEILPCEYVQSDLPSRLVWQPKQNPVNSYYVPNYIDQLTRFLNSLNIDYNSGYGTQNFAGTIWFSDGTWSTRDEYDGSEWWSHKSCPPLPNPTSNTTDEQIPGQSTQH